MEFKNWINKKYIEWRGDSRKTISQFAVFLGISGATVSAWINGTRGTPTTSRIIQKLVEKYGDEVYEILGIPKPDYEQVDISSLPEDLQERLRSAITEIDSVLKARELSVETVEGRKVVGEILAKYGFSITTKK